MAEAESILRKFSEKWHTVVTAVAFSLRGSAPESEVVESRVYFKPLNDKLIRTYFQSVDPMDKAGAYDIDQNGDLIIQAFEGSRTNIMGLPRETVGQWLVDNQLIVAGE